MQSSIKKIKQSLIWIIFATILITMNITKVVHITKNLRFNMALSDLIILIAALGVVIAAVREKNHKIIYGLPYWLGLVVWIIFVGFLGIRSESIIDGGWLGVLEELFKTGLCIFYFIVGQHTLKVIKISSYKSLWSLATVIFVFGGLVIYILGIKGIYLWSEDTKYLSMFMGTDTDPNHAATFLTLSFFAMGLFALTAKTRMNRFWFLGVLSLSIFGVIFTGSRGGLIGLVMGLMVLFLYYLKQNWRLAISLLCVFIVMGLIFIQVDTNYFEGQFTQRTLNKFLNFESGLDIRWSLGYSALQMGHDYPLTGVGRGNYILNSAPYFEEIGMSFFDDIPHNTYWGLYAEVGLVGVFLFFMPLWLLLVSVFHRFKENKQGLKAASEGLAWLFAGLVALAVQAFVLNVENRRFLWYLAGTLIFIFKSHENIFETEHGHLNIRWKKITFVTIIVTVLAYIGVGFDAHLPKQTTVVKGELLERFVYAIPMQVIELGLENVVGIELVVPNNSELTDRIRIKIVMSNAKGVTKTLVSNMYQSVNGKLFIPFVPSVDAHRVYVELISLDETLESYDFKPISVLSSEKVYEMDKWYFLQPPFISDVLAPLKRVSASDYFPETDLQKGFGQIFDAYFKIGEVSYELETVHNDAGEPVHRTLVSVAYEVIESVDENYTVLLLGYPLDLATQSVATQRNGYEDYVLSKPVETSTWVKGETYTLTYILPSQEGIYNFRMGMYIFKDEQWVYLYANERKPNRSAYVDLGWLNFTHLLDRK